MSSPVPIYIDSSALRQETHRQSVSLERLRDLAERGLVQVFVHEIVRREFSTGIAATAGDAFAKAEKDLKRAVSWSAAATQQRLEPALSALSAGRAELDGAIHDGFNQWLDALSAEVVAVAPEHTKEVWDRYFNGQTPFKVRKARNDLPDGFIYVGGMALQQKLNRSLHVAVVDGALSEAFAQNGDRVTVHASLGSFFTSDDVKNAVREHERQITQHEKWLSDAEHAIRQQRSDVDKLVYESIVRQLDGKDIESPEFPSDNHDATLQYPGDLDEVSIDLKTIEDLGTDAALVKARVRLTGGTAALFIYKADYASIAEDEDLKFHLTNSDWNRHYVAAETYVTLDVWGTARIEFEQTDDAPIHVAAAEMEEIEEIDVNVEG